MRALQGSPLRLLWLILAGLSAAAQIVMVSATQENPALTLLTLLCWGGALLCVEDMLPSLHPSPGWFSLVIGTVLVLSGLIRTASILSLDGISQLLPLWLGTGLFLLCSRPRHWRRWSASLVALALIPLCQAVTFLLPEQPLSHFTARLSQGLLLLFDVDTMVSGRLVTLPGGSVTIAGSCAGLDQIAQLLAISVLFLLAFPLPSRVSRGWMVAVAPVVAVLGNTIRITVLALITASGSPTSSWWFDFFHEETGSLVFAGLNVLVFGWIYLRVLDRQLNLRDGLSDGH
ncbi:MAG: exosortase/archaeosortase family protein [Cyanobacteriota bacterium]|nr:exosortase/archaeosortase family protein [Cyanobacteriota bacterium]